MFDCLVSGRNKSDVDLSHYDTQSPHVIGCDAKILALIVSQLSAVVSWPRKDANAVPIVVNGKSTLSTGFYFAKFCEPECALAMRTAAKQIPQCCRLLLEKLST